MDQEEMTHDDEFWEMFREFIDIVKPLRSTAHAFTQGASEFLALNVPVSQMPSVDAINQWARIFNFFTQDSEVEGR